MFEYQRMFRSISFLLAALLLGCRGSESPTAQFLDPVYTTYLTTRVRTIDVVAGGDLAGYAILGPRIVGAELILSGESHGVAWNYPLMLNLFRFLHQNHGVRCLVLEYGQGLVWMGSRYLEDGNERWLDWMFASLQGTAAHSLEARQFWVNLRAMYANLPVADRFQVVGIDIEHQQHTALWVLARLLPATERTPLELQIAALAEQVEAEEFRASNLPAALRTGIRDALMELWPEIQARESDYRRRLGDSYPLFATLAENGQIAVRYYAGHAGDKKIREEALVANFRRVYQALPMGARRCYGQLGRSHTWTLSTSEHTVSPFAERLQRDADSPLRGQVFHVCVAYVDCLALTGGQTQSVDMSWFRSADPFRSEQAGPAAIYDLMDSGSPFLTRSDWFRPNYLKGEASAIEAMQALIVLKGSPACTPLP